MDNIRMDLDELKYEDVDWIELVRNLQFWEECPLGSNVLWGISIDGYLQFQYYDLIKLCFISGDVVWPSRSNDNSPEARACLRGLSSRRESAHYVSLNFIQNVLDPTGTYGPFAETRQRKQSKSRVATADSKEWTKRAVSSVYSLHSYSR
jgi:hypothetical protein